jgi:hypothetical protein
MNKQRIKNVAKRRETTLVNRGNAVNQFRQPLLRFRAALAEIKPLWDRLTPEHREQMLAADPVLGMARKLYDELKGWFDAER